MVLLCTRGSMSSVHGLVTSCVSKAAKKVLRWISILFCIGLFGAFKAAFVQNFLLVITVQFQTPTPSPYQRGWVSEFVLIADVYWQCKNENCEIIQY